MPTQLTQLQSPGNQVNRDLAGKPSLIDAFHRDWTARLRQTIARPPRPIFYDPVSTPTADDVERATVKWTAFPKRLHPTTARPTMDDFRQGDEKPDDPNYFPDNSRGWQDEYCEWMVEKNAVGQIVRVVFTCENPDYWDQLWQTDPQTVIDLYREFIDPGVVRADLEDAAGGYDRENKWNNSVRHAMHLVSAPNNLFAEIRLAADATILRKRPDGTVITNRDELIKCARFGSAGRHSDPSIGSAVNGLARDERAGQITLADPFGLYIDKASLDLASGFQLPATAPAGTHPRDYWKVLRGTDEFPLRVQYAVPPAQGFTVGDIRIDGEPIRFGGQIAETMQIKLTAQYASIRPSAPSALFCGAPEILGFLNPSFEQIRLLLQPGEARTTRVLGNAGLRGGVTLRELIGRATITLGAEIPVTDPDFKVFSATVSVAVGAAAGTAFFIATNPSGAEGPPCDPQLEILASAAPPVAAAPAAAVSVPTSVLAAATLTDQEFTAAARAPSRGRPAKLAAK